MANERTGEHPVQKSADKAVAPRSRHRSGHSGRQSQNPGGRKFLQQNTPDNLKARRHWTWRDYALQLSVVVIGIMVTFIGSDLISRWSRARQVKAVMHLVADELRINRAELQKVCEKLRYDRNGMLMYLSYDADPDKIPDDSLAFYINIIGTTESLRPRVDALEVLKTSGVIASVNNKQLLLEILGSYNRLHSLSTDIEDYNRRKMEALDHLFANSRNPILSETNARFTWNAYGSDPMCAAFMGCMAYYFGYKDPFDGFVADVDQTLASIIKEYGFE